MRILRPYYFLFVVLGFGSCQKVEKGEDLTPEVIEHIRSLGLLTDSEKIILYYSNFTKNKAGSFFTDRRIAHYWIDKSGSKTDTSFAFYPDITSIDTIGEVPDLDCPYMEIRARNGIRFRAYVQGSAFEKRFFFLKAMATWRTALDKVHSPVDH